MKTSLLLFITIILGVFSISCSEDSSGWQQISASNSPSSRYDSCSFYQNDIKSLYIIGGLTENQKYDDIWKLDTKTDKWKKLSAPSGGLNLEAGGRINSCAFDQDTDSLYLYGINQGGNASPSRILKWYVNDNRLEEIAASNLLGTSRGHSLLLLKKGLSEPSLVVFGGEDAGYNKNNEIRIFGLNSKKFETLVITGLKPEARILHAAAISKNNEMIIIGGKSTSPLNDIWSFNFSTKKWTLLSDDNKNIKAYSTSNTYSQEDSSILLYGGKSISSSKFSSTLVKYNMNKKSWSEIDSNSEPGALSGASEILTPSNDLYIFGGNSINSKNETVPTNALWKYTF